MIDDTRLHYLTRKKLSSKKPDTIRLQQSNKNKTNNGTFLNSSRHQFEVDTFSMAPCSEDSSRLSQPLVGFSSSFFSSNHGISRSTIYITSSPPYLNNHVPFSLVVRRTLISKVSYLPSAEVAGQSKSSRESTRTLLDR